VTGLLSIDASLATPLYVQLEQGIRASIAAGRLQVGAQLPTVRQLAVDLRVNANTVARVYADLERAGVLATRRGVGTFVAESGPAAAPRPNKRDLGGLVRRWADEALANGHSLEDVIEEFRHLARKP